MSKILKYFKVYLENFQTFLDDVTCAALSYKCPILVSKELYPTNQREHIG